MGPDCLENRLFRLFMFHMILMSYRGIFRLVSWFLHIYYTWWEGRCTGWVGSYPLPRFPAQDRTPAAAVKGENHTTEPCPQATFIIRKFIGPIWMLWHPSGRRGAMDSTADWKSQGREFESHSAPLFFFIDLAHCMYFHRCTIYFVPYNIIKKKYLWMKEHCFPVCFHDQVTSICCTLP